MNIYYLSQNVVNGYDTFDSCVVTANSEEEARNMKPSNYCSIGTKQDYAEWSHPEFVKVQLIGKALDNLPPEVICASYNAG